MNVTNAGPPFHAFVQPMKDLPRIHGLLSWYDESAAFLAAAVSSFAQVCDTITAVDGAYALYPDSRPRSLPIQAEVIADTCDALGVACTIHRPADVWQGNEVEKRTALFRLAQAQAELHHDWYWVFDADCVLTEWPADLKATLAEIPVNAAEVQLFERRDYVTDHPDTAAILNLPTTTGSHMRMLFRALKDMQAVDAHYVYGGWNVAGDWEYAWGPKRIGAIDAATLDSVRVEHRSIWRDKYRRELAQSYYELRDQLRPETITPKVDA